ncbi:hypothetical protein IAU59_000323 [Kwoniella sp. CBS 9459]
MYPYRLPATIIDPNNVDGMDLETYLAAYNGEYEENYSPDEHWLNVREFVGKGVPNRERNEKLLASCGGARSLGELLHMLRNMIRDDVEDLMGEECLVDIVRMEMNKIKESQGNESKKGKKRR